MWKIMFAPTYAFVVAALVMIDFNSAYQRSGVSLSICP